MKNIKNILLGWVLSLFIVTPLYGSFNNLDSYTSTKHTDNREDNENVSDRKSYSINIDVTDYKQTIDMMGGDMERSANAIHNSTNMDEILDWGFKDIEFNVCRVQLDKHQEMEEGVKNWAFYDKQVQTMKRIQERNPNIKFFATLRTDYDGYGDDNNLPDWLCNYETKDIDTDKLAVFLVDYVDYINSQRLPIRYISTVKEWSSYVKPEIAEQVILKFNRELETRKIEKPLIIDQGFWSISQGISYLEKIKSLGTKDLYHGFCSHNYKPNEDLSKWHTFIDASTELGKPAYNDETGGCGGGPTSGAEPDIIKPIKAYVEKCITYEAGLKGEVFFEIWSRGLNRETRAIYFPWEGKGARMRGYYIMKHFANNILNHKYITSTVESMPDVYTMSFRLDNKVVLWVVNNSSKAYSATPISISNGTTTTGIIDKMYWTSDTPIIGLKELFKSKKDSFVVDIAPESLNSFIFEVE